jgi:hypothetical protein
VCIPVILPEAAIGLAAAHILGVGLIAGIVVINSNGVRRAMGALLGIWEDPRTEPDIVHATKAP